MAKVQAASKAVLDALRPSAIKNSEIGACDRKKRSTVECRFSEHIGTKGCS